MQRTVPIPSRHRVATAAIALLVIVSGCGGGTGSGADKKALTPIDAPAGDFVDRTGTDTVDISVKDNEFTPHYLMITAGTKVIWTVVGANVHNVSPVDNGSFTANREMGHGAMHTVTFKNVGDYAYFCSFHGTKKSGQRGGIRVVAKK